jgi:Tol biopolymer transport system component
VRRLRITPASWRADHLLVGVAVVAFAATLALPGSSTHDRCRALPVRGASGATGTIAFSCYGESTSGAFNSDIYVVNADGTNLRRLTEGWAWDIEPAWSPDGAQIAFVSTRDGQRDLYTMNADGSSTRRLTDDVWPDGAPAWSPDGMSIAFQSSREGSDDIYVMNADGTDRRRLTSDPGIELHPAWSPDGTRIAFMAGRGFDFDIYVMHADGSGRTRLTSAPGIDGDPAWSPDGASIAFASQRALERVPEIDAYEGELYLMRSDGTGQQRVLPGRGYKPAWSPNGAWIVFDSDRAGPFQLYLVHPDGSRLIQLVDSPLQSFSPNWRPVSP